MKASLVTSAVLHGLVLSWALLTLSGPKTLDVADSEALPVDIVPVQSITQVQKGDKKAPKADFSAPKPTVRPDPVKDAKEVGNNSVDLKEAPSAKESPRQVEAAAPPKAAEKPTPKIDDKVAEAPKPQPEPTPVPKPEPKQTKVASLPDEMPPAKPAPAPDKAPAAVVTPEPSAETAAPQPSDQPKFASLPDSVPTPEARPKPPQPKKVEKTEPKKPDTPKKVEKKSEPKKPDDVAKKIEEAATTKKNDFDADKIASLLNRQKSTGGGAKRSTREASLGADRKTSGEKLTQSEMDALRGQIQKNWNIIPGLADGQDVRVRVSMRLDPSGAIVGSPQVQASGGSDETRRTLKGSAIRAVLMSSPFKGLPREKYDAWSEVVVNFDPSQLQMY